MGSTVFSIVVSYTMLAFLLLIFSMRTTFHWILKASLITAVTFFYILTYNSFKEILGWPTKESLPERFRLVAAQIYEPNVVTSSEGSIFIWITDMNDRSGLGTPRSFEIKYSKQLHEQVSKATISLKNGIPQMGEIKEDKEDVGIISQVLEKKKTVASSINVNFFDMPNQLLPEK